MNSRLGKRTIDTLDKCSHSFTMTQATLVDDLEKSLGVNQSLQNGVSGLFSAFRSRYLMKSILP